MGEFIVSARKYRPATFESVVGQEHITSTLRNAIVRKQLAHAYLFCGPRGVGKTTCARILAKTINCLHPKENAEACDECESCRAFNDGRSFNIHELDAASNNSVEYIRVLTDQVRIPPQVGKYSIYIIDEAHMLSAAAFNAFLKTLEEPPAHVIFILATTEKHKILPTILSRCQIYDFKRIKVEDVVKYLQFISGEEGISYDDESLHIIAQKADGCMRDALSMYDKVVSFCGNTLRFNEVAESLNVLDYDTYFHFVDALTAGNYAEALMRFDGVLQKGFDAQTFMGGLSAHLRNLLVAKNTDTLRLLEMTGSIAERFAVQAANCPLPFIYDGLNIIAQAEAAFKQVASLRLHAELAILKLCNLSPIKLSAGSIDTVYTLPAIVLGGGRPVNTAGAVQPSGQPISAPSVKESGEVAAGNTAGSVSGSAGAVQEKEELVGPVVKEKKRSDTIAVEEAGQAENDAACRNTVPPRPENAVRSDAPVISESAPKPSKQSRLGISISGMLQEPVKQEVKKEEKTVEEEKEIFIAEEDIPRVLAGCKRYAEELMERRPRLSQAFFHAKVAGGKLEITVPNLILQEELLNNKYKIVNSLARFSGVKAIDITVKVDESAESVKTVLVRDEDKFKFLASQNHEVIALCKALDLDYI